MAEFASKGVAGAGLGTGIAGLSLGVLNTLGGLGGILLGNRAVPFAAGMAAEAGCSENHTVNRYELSMVQENAKLRSDIALRDANTYADLSRQELGHANKLHEMAVRHIEKAKDAGLHPTEAMQAVWNWEHERMLDRTAHVKTLLSMM